MWGKAGPPKQPPPPTTKAPGGPALLQIEFIFKVLKVPQVICVYSGAEKHSDCVLGVGNELLVRGPRDAEAGCSHPILR